ncbi:vacuolar protein sorting-associated protein 53 A isoform X1 [Physcomitrium patens]|uniref:Uncharacterized protein n=1 Tax=Physcomitrium patens TaxID=3218 RepID=A0A2K1K6K5_PHYPA|nr:vacuolar protein sorting-associated protein 53 A-like isoform X1 [Physcomitrium patens]XP_024383134.1 vacuolar protein sorting-associated protein 53 A-like isoform X1 [Physcomitrium patens]PNR49405.1 hypothetical protein PHYPA_011301 [Physcomitrium patens]|eukprot:XP_024383133.1 vacuolar protein sorting-associated protein 53 A-like isoform X1 [Physcomitrella patens]
MARTKASTLEFINEIFPTEASLVAVDPLLGKLRNKIRHVDAEIISAIRQQSTSGSKAKEDLAAAMRAIQELTQKISEMKEKAEQSEVMVQEICRDIKKLDFAKKNITTTVTALHRLAMLVSAVEQLQAMAVKRQYKEAAGQLEAVNQLCSHFEAYSDIPKITELREKFKGIKDMLKSHVFSDFASLGTAGLSEDGQQMQQLADACLVIDGLDPSAKEELIRNVCSKELTAYQQIFQGTEVAKLEKAERRYAWIKRQLRSNEEVWSIFPPSWRVAHTLCIQFCKVTRAQLMEILDTAQPKPEVGTLLQALQRTLEFEEELAERFGGSEGKKQEEESDNEGFDTKDGKVTASSIRKKYQKLKQETDGEKKANQHSANDRAAAAFNFRGTISSCFEKHMSIYVELEEKTLMEALDKLIQEETWEAEEGTQTNVLSSGTQVFLIIKRSLKRCSALTRNQTLFNLYKVFQRVLRAYAGKLVARLPRGQPGLVSSTEGQVKVSDKDERVICYIVNTAEYCHETAANMGENVAKLIDSHFSESIDMSEEQDEFSGVITKALSILVLGLETRLENELANMARLPWATLESVGDQSDYVNGISVILSSSVPVIAGLLSPLYFQYFMDKLAASFAPKFHNNIFKCKRISETGAQQMLLDTHAVKTLLLEVPSLGGQASTPASYTKYVAREMSKAEHLLKVILSPMEAIADTYRALLPEGSGADFLRILDLKGVKRTDSQPLIDRFTNRNIEALPTSHVSGSQQSNQANTAPSTPTFANSGQQSKEAMMSRVGALGRGAISQSAAAAAAASSTGLKRLFAVVEQAKEGAAKKEGSHIQEWFSNIGRR